MYNPQEVIAYLNSRVRSLDPRTQNDFKKYKSLFALHPSRTYEQIGQDLGLCAQTIGPWFRGEKLPLRVSSAYARLQQEQPQKYDPHSVAAICEKASSLAKTGIHLLSEEEQEKMKRYVQVIELMRQAYTKSEIVRRTGEEMYTVQRWASGVTIPRPFDIYLQPLDCLADMHTLPAPLARLCGYALSTNKSSAELRIPVAQLPDIDRDWFTENGFASSVLTIDYCAPRYCFTNAILRRFVSGITSNFQEVPFAYIDDAKPFLKGFIDSHTPQEITSRKYKALVGLQILFMQQGIFPQVRIHATYGLLARQDNKELLDGSTDARYTNHSLESLIESLIRLEEKGEGCARLLLHAPFDVRSRDLVDRLQKEPQMLRYAKELHKEGVIKIKNFPP